MSTPTEDLRVKAVNISISIVVRLAVVHGVTVVAKAPGVRSRSCIKDELSAHAAIIKGVGVNTCKSKPTLVPFPQQISEYHLEIYSIFELGLYL